MPHSKGPKLLGHILEEIAFVRIPSRRLVVLKCFVAEGFSEIGNKRGRHGIKLPLALLPGDLLSGPSKLDDLLKLGLRMLPPHGDARIIHGPALKRNPQFLAPQPGAIGKRDERHQFRWEAAAINQNPAALISLNVTHQCPVHAPPLCKGLCKT